MVIALRLKLDNSPDIWLPKGDPEVKLYESFKDRFGNDSFIALVSQDLNLETAKDDLSALLKTLKALPETATVHAPFDHLGKPTEDALSQKLLSPSSPRVTYLISLPKEATPAQAAQLIVQVEQAAAAYPKLGHLQVVGTEIVTRDLNKGSEKSFGGLFPLVALALSSIVFAALRSLPMVLATLVSAIMAIIAAVACLAAWGATMNLLVVLMPAILVVLTVAAAVHLCSRYLVLASEATQETQQDRNDIWRMAVEQTIKPCGLATATTALGFGSLAVSQVGPVRDLGLFTAIGSLWVLLFVFVLVPVLVSQRPVETKLATFNVPVDSYLAGLARVRVGILFLGMLFFVVGVLGLFRLKLESNILEFFPKNHPLPRAYSDFEGSFFGLTAFEILIDGPVGKLSSPETLVALDRLADEAEALGLSTNSISPWLKAEEPRMLSALLKEVPPEAQGYLWRGGASGSVRATFTAPTGSSNDAYRKVLALRELCLRMKLPRGVFARVGGAAPLLARGQVLLLDTQIRSFAVALILITIVISVAYRSFRLTALSLLCNVFPVVGTLGLMGWLEIPLNAGTVTVAGIALGLIVDDTIHLLHGFDQNKTEGDVNRRLAQTLESAGKPILVTTVAVAVGFGLFSVASFTPTKYFGLLTATTSVFALLADLVLLPSLLCEKKSAGELSR